MMAVLLGLITSSYVTSQSARPAPAAKRLQTFVMTDAFAGLDRRSGGAVGFTVALINNKPRVCARGLRGPQFSEPSD